MKQPSTQLSPITLELTATKVVSDFGRKTETIIDEEKIHMGYEGDKSGSCEINNEITLAGVFGQYTSLKTGIRVQFPCDPVRFEAEAERYHTRIVTAIQKFQNRVLEATGRPTVWQAGPTLPAVAAPTDHGLTREALDGPPPAPPEGAIPPAPEKRTRRPRR